MPEYKTKEEFYAAANRWLAQLQADESLKSRIGQQELSVGFTLTDLGAEFSLKFANGEVTGGPGGANECTIGVITTSKVFDGIFCGTTDPESAYMYGSITLRGSEYTAQGLLGYMGAMIKNYKAATSAG